LWPHQLINKCDFLYELARPDHQDGSASFAGLFLHARHRQAAHSFRGSFICWFWQPVRLLVTANIKLDTVAW
jgi:hypothetical protein